MSVNMAGKSFSVKIQLELHAVTCPGVWLCPNGNVSLRIFTLNSSIESHKVTPIFPLLFHNKFIFKKIFTKVSTLNGLENHLEEEFFHVELVQWSPPSTRRIILATFETNLVDLLYPATCSKGLLAGVDVDLLMEPTNHFPGIIAPKIEISTRTTIEEVLSAGDLNLESHVVNPKTICSKTSCIHRKPPAKGIIRQRKVCHSHGKTKLKPSWTCTQNLKSLPSCHCFLNERSQSRTSNCYHNNRYQIPNDTHVFNKCPVCLRYKCYFSKIDEDEKDIEECTSMIRRKSYDEILKEIKTSNVECNCQSSTNFNKKEPYHSAISMLRSKIKNLQRDEDHSIFNNSNHHISENVDCPYDYDLHGPRYYKNLQKFYKNLYKTAKMRVNQTECT